MKNQPEETMEFMRCAFCGGSGKDPFCIMSCLSDCPVCIGKGVVKVQAPYVYCAHCQGSGAIKKLTCTVCHGKGVVAAPTGHTRICPDCMGTGNDASASALDCLGCRGRGWITQENCNADYASHK